MPSNLPTRRIWDVIDKVSSNLVYWLFAMLAAGIFEWRSGAFKEDPFQTYSFVLLQLPFHALVVYASTCMMHIGYHLVVLGKSPHNHQSIRFIYLLLALIIVIRHFIDSIRC